LLYVPEVVLESDFLAILFSFDAPALAAEAAITVFGDVVDHVLDVGGVDVG
jgi:hypothetical protein